MSDIAIKLENISKQYRLGTVGTNSMKADIESWWSRLRGKENKYLQIGQKNVLSDTTGEYVWALRDINLEVKKGEILGIIGKNGAGKSTLLKLLSRVTGPTTGQIKINGRIASLLEVGTGFHAELTGRENIFLNGSILGMTKNDIRRQLDEIVEFAGIAKYIDTPVKRYSSGMYVRLGFAVAAHLNTDILIVDEVLAVGDAEFQKKAIGKMKEVSQGRGRTVFFVSHNMNSINRLCNTGLLLSNGQIVHQGTTEEVIKHYLTVDTTGYTTHKKFPEGQNKDIDLLEVKLEDESGKVIPGLYDVHDSFFINYRIKLNKQIEKTHITFHFKNVNDEFVWFSDRNDITSNFLPTDKGEYTIKIKIKQPLLKPDRYFLYLGITNKDNEQTNHFPSILNFELKDFKNERYQRVGYIYKPLKWEIDKI